MGIVGQRLNESAKEVVIDLTKPKIALLKADRDHLADIGDGSRMVICSLVQAKFPKGMNPLEGKIWAVWQETLVESEQPNSNEITITMGQLDWLVDLLKDQSIAIAVGWVQWRYALLWYLEEVKGQTHEP
jgi:hypothetical protein